ncbi:MAG: long-chain fatty acid--CoA ligase [Myxococcaceae bacterium]|nr:long-chain fatty acid--CoA ligase [Myxococcaceae bacterium]
MHGSMMTTPLTLTPFLERARLLFSDREIVSRLPSKALHRTTYGDFARRSLQLAAALTAAGLRKGDRVATLMWNHSAHLEAYFGIPAAGGVLHTLNLRLHPDQLAWIINDAADRFLIVDDVLLPILAKVQDRVKLEKIFVVASSGAPVPPGFESYEDLLSSAPSGFTPPALAESDVAGLCYTSGTTGNPKGVAYTHRSTVLHCLAVSLADTLAVSGRETVLPVVPMFHVNAWGLPFAAVMVGAKLVLPGPHLDAESLLELFEKEQVTLTAGVPTIWMGILAALEQAPSRWKLQRMRMVVGGSAVPESVIRGFDRHGQTVVHAWGMTETSPVGTVSHLSPALANASEDERYQARARQGTPVPLVEIRAVGDTGPVAWDGQSMGELQVRGPWIAGSYFGGSQDPDKFTADGWFRTGDVVTIDRHGCVKITDRTKDLIKSGGEWISSVDLENALIGHPAVKEACVIAVTHPKWAERPLAAVVLKPGAQATAAELRAFLEPRFARWWVPEAYAFVAEIPKTSAGKFLKSALRDQFKDWKWD